MADRRTGEARALVEEARLELRTWARKAPGLRRLDNFYRKIHTLKGLFGGSSTLRQQIHLVEEVLDGLRTGRLEVDGDLLRALSEAVESWSRHMEGFGEPEIPEEALRDALDRQSEEVSLGFELETAIDSSISKAERAQLVDALRRDHGIWAVHCEFQILELAEGMGAVRAGLVGLGLNLVASVPIPGEDPMALRMAMLVTGDLIQAQAIRELDGAVGEIEELAAPSLDESEQAHVSVDAKALDRLVDLAGELRQQRAVRRRWVEGQIEALPRREASEARSQLREENRLFEELAAQALVLRLVDLSTLEEGLREDVVGACELLADRQVTAEIELAGPRLDAELAQRLRQVLLHLVRNAVAHGIEPVEERRRIGKAAEGTLRVTARQVGTAVEVLIEDDGRGLDYPAIRRRAMEMDLIDFEHQRSDQELADLVFSPGFSSRESADQLSGRGVGLDAVRSIVRMAGGSVTLTSVAGKGTTVAVSLPSTFGLQQVQLVLIDENLLGIPLPLLKSVDRSLGTFKLDLVLGIRRRSLRVQKILGQPWVVARPLPPAIAPEGLLAAFTWGRDDQVGYLIDPFSPLLPEILDA